MEGSGRFKWADGDVYIGTWKNNKRQGEGKLIAKEGVTEINKTYSMGVEVQ